MNALERFRERFNELIDDVKDEIITPTECTSRAREICALVSYSADILSKMEECEDNA